jgi:hypothetical protein
MDYRRSEVTMSFYVSTVKRQILIALRDSYGEHYGTADIADLIGEPVFRVRAELRDMARRSWGPLVRETTIRRRLEWELTPAGEAVSWGEDIDFGGL